MLYDWFNPLCINFYSWFFIFLFLICISQNNGIKFNNQTKKKNIDLLEIFYHNYQNFQFFNFWPFLEFLNSLVNLCGSTLFISGNIIFLEKSDSDYSTKGGLLFIFGSICFITGAIINIIQMYGEQTPGLERLANAVGLNYFAGSILFLLGSVFYELNLSGCNSSCKQTIFSYSAGEYLTGSLFFVIGSFLNLIRNIIVNHVLKLHQSKNHRNTAELIEIELSDTDEGTEEKEEEKEEQKKLNDATQKFQKEEKD